MMRAEFPPVAELVPHTGDMVWLSRVVGHGGDRTVCEVDIDGREFLPDPDGNVPVWVGLEFMAQCVAAHGGLVGREKGELPQIGYLLGSRCLTFHTDFFRSGQRIKVSAARVWGRAGGLVAFDCVLEDCATGAALAEARLSCLMTPAKRGTGGPS